VDIAPVDRETREQTMNGPPVGEGANHDIIVVGASAGGVEALLALVRELPADLPAAVCIVLHASEREPSLLPEILRRAGALPVQHARDGEALRRGHIFVAPPNYHLLVQPGRLHVWDGPRENRVRPAADALFRTAAQSYGPRVAGVVLSGTLDDGSAGLVVIKRWGGVAIVQDPQEAGFPGMPESAISTGVVDAILPVSQIAALLTQLAGSRLPQARALAGAETEGFPFPPPHPIQLETTGGSTMSMRPLEPPHGAERPDLNYAVQHPTGTAPSGLICPECGGALWERSEEGVLQYRCHVGHILSLQSMLHAQGEALEMALWNAVRSLRERAALYRRVAESAPRASNLPSQARALEEANDLDEQATLIQNVLLRQIQSEAS
jgi:two-component system chemotaxis response regulator CheB